MCKGAYENILLILPYFSFLTRLFLHQESALESLWGCAVKENWPAIRNGETMHQNKLLKWPLYLYKLIKIAYLKLGMSSKYYNCILLIFSIHIFLFVKAKWILVNICYTGLLAAWFVCIVQFSTVHSRNS